MATTRDVYLDLQTGAIYDSFRSQSALTLWDFVQGDTGLFWRIHALMPKAGESINSDEPFEYLDVETENMSLQLGLGNLNESSTGGTGSVVDPETESTSGVLVSGARYYIQDYNAGDDFTNVGGTNVTGNIFTASGTTPTTWTNASTLIQIADGIAYNASASAFQSAINTKLLSNYSTATVTIGDEANPWTIDRVAVGDIETLRGLGDLLTPDSVVQVKSLNASATGSMRQRVRFIQKPAVYADTSTYFAAASGAVATRRVGTANLNAIQRITFSENVYGGTYELQSTSLGAGGATTRATLPIPFGATKEEIEDLINDASSFGSGNEVTVSIVNERTIDIIFTGTDVKLKAQTVMTIDDDGLLGMKGWLAEINSNTSTASDLLGDEDSVQTTFEIQITDGDGLITTPYQINDATLRAELIAPETTGATEYPGFATAAMFALIHQYDDLAITAATTNEITIPKYCKWFTLDVTVGAGAYPANIDLASVSANRVAGDKCEAILALDAGFTSAGSIVVRNDTGSAVLWTEPGVDAAIKRILFFTWTGSTWKSDQ